MHIRPETLLEFCLKNRIKHVAFTYTEPFTWFEYVYQSALFLRKNNISVVLVTNGYVNLDPLNFILPLISAMNIDLKSFSENFYKTICGGKLQPVLDVIRVAHARTHVEVTLLLLETLNDDLSELHSLFAFLRSISSDIPLHISKYFPRYKMTIRETNEAKLHRIAQIAETYLKHVYVGNVRARV
jgi:pyruvate formate lyase activating enzyme